VSELPILGGGELPYSKGVLARALMAVGLPAERAYLLAVAVQEDLTIRGERSIDLDRFEELARTALGEEEGSHAALSLRRFDLLGQLGQPLILLIGGATGSGKSTVATEVAYRLGITRVTSTDFMRHTMRAVFSRDFMPAIHYSSFEAGRAMDAHDGENAVVAGFLEQTRNVSVGVQASVERAIQERWSLVL
jgi:2-phosphoglycerate kinase